MLNDFVNQFWPATIDGLAFGSIYALIALGYTMVYGVLQLINFAHGDVFMLGAMMGWYASARWTGEAKDPSIWGAVLVALASMIICALVRFERTQRLGPVLLGRWTRAAVAPRPDGSGAMLSTTALGRDRVIRPPPMPIVKTVKASTRQPI